MNAPARSTAPPLSAVQRYFEISLCLLVATGILAVVSTGKLDKFSTFAPLVALIFKGVRVLRGRGPELSTRVSTWIVLAYLLFFPVDLWFVSRNLAAGAPNPALYAGLLASIHLMLFATLVRLFSARTTRDHVFLAMLAFSAMLASAILTVDTAFVVALAVFLMLAVSTFVGLEICRAAEGAVSPPLEKGTPAARRMHRALWMTSILVALSALLVGGGIFFLIPRFTAGYLSALSLQPTLMTGFNDNVTLGEIGQIKKSGAVVMRISFEGSPVRAETIRWRGIALTNFDGRRWFTPTQDSTVVTPDPGGHYILNPEPLPSGQFYPLRYKVLMEPIATDAIFLAARTAQVRGRFGVAPAGPGQPPRLAYLVEDKTDSVFNPAHNDTTIRYEALANLPIIPPSALRAAGTDYPDIIRNTYLQLPPLDPRIAKLADQITAKAKTPYEKAANIESYLMTRYGYTLELSGTPPTVDPLPYFLFEKRAGHCEYFAAAMAVMLRTLGIPSRYITGFLPGEYNDVAGDFIVRASDAHSWVEVYFPKYGWLTFDPTPPGEARPQGLLARMALYWDWFQYNWGEWVINYDFGHQLVLTQSLQRTSHRWSVRFRKTYEAKRRATMDLMRRWQQRVATSRYTVPGAIVALLVLLLYLRGRTIGRYVAGRWALRRHREGKLPPALAALEYRQMLKLLERQGWRKSPAQTALEFASGISVAELAAPVAQLTQLYQSARFGAHAADARTMSSLLVAIKELLRSRKH